MLEENLTDEQLAQQAIFGNKPVATDVTTQPASTDVTTVATDVTTQPASTDVTTVATDVTTQSVSTDVTTVATDVTTVATDVTTQPAVDVETLPDEKVVELINKKFNTNFDNISAANDFMANQSKYKGQDKIIQQLTEKIKESSNVLSHFPSIQSYKVAQLAKEYPGKEASLSKIMNAEVDKLDDFEAISLAESLNRAANSKVDPLSLKLHRMGLKDLDVAEFEDWEEIDKQVVYGEAEDARKQLLSIQSKIEDPKEGDGVSDELISDIERGVHEEKEKQERALETNRPIAESMVSNLVKIKPVDGSDFEFEVNLTEDASKELVEFVLAESIEGGYDIKSDSDIQKLNNMLVSEIWATEGPKILAAYGKHKESQVWDEAKEKYENAQPLNDDKPVETNMSTKATDEDMAQRLLT